MRRPDKIEKEIFEMIYKEKGHVPLSVEEFNAAYIGSLMFIYHDRYGLPLSLMLEITERKLCQRES